MKKIALFLAPGFEQIEALGTLDILRRAGLPVVTAAVGTEDLFVTSTHKVTVQADCFASDLDSADLAMTVFPGGMPGAANLAASADACRLAREVSEAGGITAAICAAPIALHAAGILPGRRYTCYPSFEKQIGEGYTGARVEIDGTVITACGPGATFEFAFALLRALGLEDAACNVAKGMLV